MTMPAPVDENITIQQLNHDPYAIYKRLRVDSPVLRVKAIGRTLVTKAADTRVVRTNPELFSSDDPDTPMERAFQAHTLMRKDGDEHMRERMAMVPTFSPKNLKSLWGPLYAESLNEFLDQLPTDEIVDLFPCLAGPVAARFLAKVLGIPAATDTEMQRWSQALIEGAGNFGWLPEPFERTDKAHIEMNRCIEARIPELRACPDQSALSVMINANEPIAMSQILANMKIAIGGGINEPRDALLTILFGLLNNPDQLQELKHTGKWGDAFEEGVRWVAPIQVSSRRATEDTEIRGFQIVKNEVVMIVQASANHDEELFEEPERFNVFRKKTPHQSFGGGPHHCMGTHLARMVIGRIMLPTLFERFPNMQLVNAESVVWNGFGFRGPLNLPVRLN